MTITVLLWVLTYFLLGAAVLPTVMLRRGHPGIEAVPGSIAATRGRGAARVGRIVFQALWIVLFWPAAVASYYLRVHR